MNAIAQPMQHQQSTSWQQKVKEMLWDLEDGYVAVYLDDVNLNINFEQSAGHGWSNDPDDERAYVIVKFESTCTQADDEENEVTVDTPDWAHVHLAMYVEAALEDRASRNDY